MPTKNFVKYMGHREGEQARRLEMESLRDPMLSEAMQGLSDSYEDEEHRRAVSRIQRRIMYRAFAGKPRNVWIFAAIAAAILIISLVVILVVLYL